jgi:fructose-1,6-bisphosphatase/inositol monophosphatase family enzyme
MNLTKLTELAIQAAQLAGKMIATYLNEDIAVQRKSGGTSYASQVVTKVDKEAEQLIVAHLLPTISDYDLALITEETEDDASRFKKAYFWCVDPLDGTLAFIQKETGFSVSIALVAQDGTPQLGVVYDPVTQTTYHAMKDLGAFRNGIPWKIKRENPFLTYVTDKKLNETPRKEEIEALLQEKVKQLELKGINEISGGGSVMNAIRVLENGPALLFKFPKKEQGGGSIWDYAATACIFHELGLQATNAHGKRLDLNRKDSTFMNHEGIYYANLG